MEKVLEEHEENEKKKEETVSKADSETNFMGRKKPKLKIETIPKNDPPNNKKLGKKDIKDDRLKEKLDKLTKNIMDKDSSIDSHSVSRNTFLSKNEVDWKAKRMEFLEKLKNKKTEEETFKKSAGINEKLLKNTKKTRKCVIF